MLAAVRSVALVGLDPRQVTVECSVGPGLPAVRLVGLPDSAVREAGDRVKAAVQASGWRWPQERVVVNLAPARLPKTGSGFDLPIALAVLAACRVLPSSSLDGVWACGELGLDGRVRHVPGALPIGAASRRFGADRLLVAEADGGEAALVDGLDVVAVPTLAAAVEILAGRTRPPRPVPVGAVDEDRGADLADVRGQPVARRALEVAAAGGHHLLLVGPPGCGKSMLARRLPGILPPLTAEEALEVASVHSVAGVRRPDAPLSLRPPFRDPHHTISSAGLIGGGPGTARPGELSLASCGVLFLDELLEVPRWILDALRQPLEQGHVTIVRARATVRFPARILLVAATNPCPCGHLGDRRRACRCRPDEVHRYRARLSGPLLDRIDLQVALRPLEPSELVSAPPGEPSAAVAPRILAARAAAAERWGRGALNRDAAAAAVRATAAAASLRCLARAVEALGLSARAFDRCLRVARTLADLDGAPVVVPAHVEEAVGYRLPPALPAA